MMTHSIHMLHNDMLEKSNYGSHSLFSFKDPFIEKGCGWVSPVCPCSSSHGAACLGKSVQVTGELMTEVKSTHYHLLYS